MKNLEKIIILVVIVVPIVICSVILKSIWSDDKNNDKGGNKTNTNSIITEISDPYYTSGDDKSGEGNLNESGDVMQMGGNTFVSKIGDPISKVYSDASISSASANIYSEASETSEVVGKFEKYTKITAQKFEQGWSRVTGTTSNGTQISGWMKTENITYPDGNGSSLNTSSDTKTGTVTAEPYLNVRVNPSTTASILTTVTKGESVTIKETSNGWYKITVNGLTGWVSSAYVKLK